VENCPSRRAVFHACFHRLSTFLPHLEPQKPEFDTGERGEYTRLTCCSEWQRRDVRDSEGEALLPAAALKRPFLILTSCLPKGRCSLTYEERQYPALSLKEREENQKSTNFSFRFLRLRRRSFRNEMQEIRPCLLM